MNQYVTPCNSKLYTIQPGDATRYTFMISKIVSSNPYTKEFDAVSTTPEEPLPYSSKYQQLLPPPMLLDAGFNMHFTGYRAGEKLYLISIFSPSPTCFAISESQLARLRDTRDSLVSYIMSHLKCANRYTVYVVLACLESLKSSDVLPDEVNLQEALIKAIDIVPFINATREEAE